MVVAGPSQMHRCDGFLNAAIAQLAEQFICNELVPDSTSGCGSNNLWFLNRRVAQQ